MGGKKKILVVDDEPKIRNLFGHYLQTAGYQVISAEDGEKALMVLKEDGSIDLVILDIGLPKVSGLEVFEMIKTRFPQLKILVSSVYSPDEQEFLVWDADGYYYKSESISVLKEKVKKILT